MHYLEFLDRLHKELQPEMYFEIGIRDGSSLSLSRSFSIAVDPAFRITKELRCDCRLHKKTSDDFFKTVDFIKESQGRKLGLALIDGMHLSDFAFRDFMNIYKYSHEGTFIIFDDIIPASMDITTREQLPGAWTGDVYKVIRFLKDSVPEMKIITVDTKPSGLGIAYNLNDKIYKKINKIGLKKIESLLIGDEYEFSSLEDLRKEFSPMTANDALNHIKTIRERYGI